jgi:hypothetical protein
MSKHMGLPFQNPFRLKARWTRHYRQVDPRNAVRRLPPGAWINRYQDEQKHHRDGRERNEHDHY